MSDLPKDGVEYNVLENAVRKTNGLPGIILEIGTRLGGGTLSILENVEKERIVVGLDPYGDLPYFGIEAGTDHKYPNKMRNTFLKNIYEYVNEKELNYLFFNLEDTEFFYRFADGIPIYNNTKTIINDYALIFVDGQHCLISVLTATLFFMGKIVKGGFIVFDDCGGYKHNIIEEILFANGFQIVEGGQKKSYVKL